MKYSSLTSFFYERLNHLGNFNGCWFCEAKPYSHESRKRSDSGVLVTYSDKRLSECFEDTFYRYVADVKSQTDYSAFHALQPDRQWYSRNDSSAYRFGGSNGQEKDDEIYGHGNSYSAEFWQYDPRLGRRWNVDPVYTDWESPYACFRNNPIALVDPTGLSPDSFNVNSDILLYSNESYIPKEGAQDNVEDRAEHGDYTLTPITGKDGKTTGYSAYNNSTKRIEYTFGANRLEQFKNNAHDYQQIANLSYSNGAGWINFINGYLLSKEIDFDLVLSGYGEMWGDALTDPQYVLGVAGGYVAAYSSNLRRMAGNTVGTKVGQKQASHNHLKATRQGTKSYMDNMQDAQKVVDAVHSGGGNILKVTSEGKVYIQYNGVTGYYVNQSGTSIPTNRFYIQGSSGGNTKVVPVHPNHTP